MSVKTFSYEYENITATPTAGWLMSFWVEEPVLYYAAPPTSFLRHLIRCEVRKLELRTGKDGWPEQSGCYCTVLVHAYVQTLRKVEEPSNSDPQLRQTHLPK